MPISNIKFDKVVVWDSGQNGPAGKGATAGFLQNLAHTLPPMLEMMRDVGGVEMPEFFGKLVENGARVKKPEAVAAAGEADDDAEPKRDAGDGRIG